MLLTDLGRGVKLHGLGRVVQNERLNEFMSIK
jgi:hypothetical protein